MVAVSSRGLGFGGLGLSVFVVGFLDGVQGFWRFGAHVSVLVGVFERLAGSCARWVHEHFERVRVASLIRLGLIMLRP